MLQHFVRLLANHPELVSRLSESWPIRRAAQWTAYAFLRGKNALADVTPEVKDRAARFGETFKEELKRGWEETKRRK